MHGASLALRKDLTNALDILINNCDSLQVNEQLKLLYDNGDRVIYSQIVSHINFIISRLRIINKLFGVDKIIDNIDRFPF